MRSYIETKNLSLAAALITLGVPLSDETPFVKIKSVQGEQYTFYFEDVTACGQYRTIDLIKAWDNATFQEDEPEHPFAYISCAFKNREKLLDTVKQAIALVLIQKNGKGALVSENSSEALRSNLFSKL